MLPVVTLVGRPNVGKSTLFNRLTGTRDALVADFPGLTRDRQYGVGRIGPGRYMVVDTGGLSGESEGVDGLMERQVQRAIAEADHLLLMVDARDGCTGADQDIAERLRRTGKAVTLVVNKSDHAEPEVAAAEFHRLGLGKPVPIAATQGRGVMALMERVLSLLPDLEPDAAADRRSRGPDRRGRSPQRRQVHPDQPASGGGTPRRLRRSRAPPATASSCRSSTTASATP